MNTPETNSIIRNAQTADHPPTRLAATLTVKCEKLERERDEAIKHWEEVREYGTDEINAAVDLRQKLAQALVELDNMQDQRDLAMKVISRLERERNEAREELHDIRLNLGADAEGYTLVHAVCVLQQERDEAREDRGNSRQSLAFALEELDEAREALMKIEQLFIDGTDIYADRENMGLIARNALEETK